MKKVYKLISMLLIMSFCIQLTVSASVTELDKKWKALESISEKNTFKVLSNDESEDSVLESYSNKLDNMTVEELNAYIDKAQKSTEKSPSTDEEAYWSNLTIRVAWLAAAKILQKSGYPCAGKMLEYAVRGKKYSESTSGSGMFAKKIIPLSKFKTAINVARKSKDNPYKTSISFMKSDNKDLYYSLHNVNMSVKKYKSGNVTKCMAVISDTYDFAPMIYSNIFTTCVNNAAWLSMKKGILKSFKITITIKAL